MRPWWQADLGKSIIVVALDIYSKCGRHHCRKRNIGGLDLRRYKEKYIFLPVLVHICFTVIILTMQLPP